ncbi:acetyl-CoA carboxylase biotin carboxylase subunit [Dellaglioa sp. L3N]
MFRKILIANRGEVAERIIRACLKLKIQTVAVYSTVDAQSRFVELADEKICIGSALAKDSYLNRESLLMAALNMNVDAIHPGYGFLSEDAHFAQMCAECGLTFIGPSAALIQQLADKDKSRLLAIEKGVPVIPGSDLITSDAELIAEANKLGFPLLIKAAHGGGGKGIRLIEKESDLLPGAEIVQQEAKSSFAAGSFYLEKKLVHARHIEVQIIGDGQHIQVLGDRDCSLQKHRQKVIEESPSTILTVEQRNKGYRYARQLMANLHYVGLGTVEFLFADNQFYFLEMNTRLQVEHGVTEETINLDVVQQQLRVADGGKVTNDNLSMNGHAIECRLTLIPSLTDQITRFDFPAESRIETGYRVGDVISAFYDGLLAKIICHAETRELAILKMQKVLEAINISGVETNLVQLKAIIRSQAFRANTISIDSKI